ncbi:MAG: LysM peptidoglycan-binding domain-containing protein [Bacillota bacterium]|uniref:LysM peptidoglycan-binding domain-containing protein n=1 Tax=unclassified Virgibacillus TaxID=2620237 RepID=UPI000EF53333|nr:MULTISPECIES: LysM peptidoglycan-binding domain-containing protein [unclassified Virgibacillus]MCC2250653.1 LysM peptidoglycan-binding domain-containing protein [Virgibacillus sp. AGTR]MDY7046230.1 LysM peptidoglycan-binding domain-containing protein [Virgibacillus sp. M23]QRZ19558.1 LysM peptidoglycan-binding domain-containing protein [Virgibacillus sp. AGTR]
MQIHVIKRNDTLWNIAERYGSDYRQIAVLNQLNNPNILVIGQALVIPDPRREYVVQSGDTLWMIAQRYQIPVQEIAAVNQITDPNLLFVGQMLEIPYYPYIVQLGDSLWEIAQQTGVTVNELMRMNAITNPSLIYPGQVLKIPQPSRPVKEINAYATKTGAQGAQEILAYGRLLTYVTPFTYSIRSDGTITELNDLPILEAAEATNVLPLLVLTNFVEGDFDSDLAATLLRSPELQEKLITILLEEMQEKGYQGVNFDFEYVYPEDRENYNNFLRRVVARLHPNGYLVTTALAPKIRSDQEGLLYEAHDYKTQGEIVDFIVLMTYEWGWAGGRPLAIAPINEVRKVLDYAITVIPRDKIMMGIPLYGRDWRIPWQEGTVARTVSSQEAIQLAATYGAEIQYNDTYQSPYFRYTDGDGQQHEVWFEDARSIQAKYDILRDYDIRGASYWVLGIPFPQNWPVLQNNFIVKKGDV